jgi:hypothetical protein
MPTKANGARKPGKDPHAAMRSAEPSDAPLAVVYLAIISCAVMATIVAVVAAL